MHSQTLISVLVWVAVLCSTRVVSDELSELQKSELANNLNMLVRHSGWREGMRDVKINKGRDILYPMSAILEAISSNRKSVDESNVLERYKEIYKLLLCKYADILYKYKYLMHRFVRVCRQERKTCESSYQTYFDCFHLLLSKLHDSSSRFKCMADALVFISSLGGPQLMKSKYNQVVTGLQKLIEFTLNIRQKTLSKLSIQGTNTDVVDLEIQTISKNVSEIYDKNVYLFTYHHCYVAAQKELGIPALYEVLKDKKSNQLIPQEMTMVEYVEKEIDCYHDEISGNWFYDLGFAYDEAGNVTIGIDLNTISTELPICSVVD